MHVYDVIVFSKKPARNNPNNPNERKRHLTQKITTPTLKRCCYITVDFGTTALQNGACTYRCISKQMHYKTSFSHNGYMKSPEIYENYITLFCLEEKNFLTILYKLITMHGILPKVVELTI